VSSIVSPELRTRVRGIAVPIALAFGRIGLTPNALTVIGFAIAGLAAVAASQEAWALAGLLVIFGGVFDLFDGALARATNRVSRVGGFLDSVFDRWGEGLIYVGIVWGTLVVGHERAALLSTAAMTSAFMVSYTRAKSESLGFTPGTGMANVGLAPREIRIVILTAGLLLAGVLSRVADDGHGTPPNIVALEIALGLIAVLATITTIQRILHVVRQPQPSSEEHE
jgi:phosphatidylglycerophosphate synthase